MSLCTSVLYVKPSFSSFGTWRSMIPLQLEGHGFTTASSHFIVLWKLGNSNFGLLSQLASLNLFGLLKLYTIVIFIYLIY
ncbi:hypothetical protein GDO78_003787 [Eleutherodactylus coqui]|uniref:Uncharacterized protein n=1 Tax=Eleutherodactylus coqui TaxID=57060 RepID=A0A8J6EUH7_ELECQ|nr:hypothetical protein GDO78_003787 [Eleutherodactylus coqui]